MSRVTRSAVADLSTFLPPNAVEHAPTLDDVVRALIRYYREIEYARCDRANDGDMLLFQYGVYDWGNGRYFELDFVRQFLVGRAFGQSQMEQLHLTFFFKAELGSDLQHFNIWSRDCRDLDHFAQQVRESEGFRAAESQSPLRWEFSHEVV